MYIVVMIRAVAGQHSSYESCFVSKTLTHFFLKVHDLNLMATRGCCQFGKT